MSVLNTGTVQCCLLAAGTTYVYPLSLSRTVSQPCAFAFFYCLCFLFLELLTRIKNQYIPSYPSTMSSPLLHYLSQGQGKPSPAPSLSKSGLFGRLFTPRPLKTSSEFFVKHISPSATSFRILICNSDGETGGVGEG